MPGVKSKYLIRRPWKLSQNNVKVTDVWFVIVNMVGVFELTEWLRDSAVHDASAIGAFAGGLVWAARGVEPHMFEQLARTSKPATSSRRFGNVV
jgi:hypothetical protein